MKARVTAAAVSGLLVTGLALGAPAAHADKAKVRDTVGDAKALDIRSAKLNNGKHRLAGTVSMTRKSMRSHGMAGVQVRYNKPKVIYILKVSWRKHQRLRGSVLRFRHGRKLQVITKRCDVRAVRHRNRIRISVNQRHCFRRDAGRARFAAFSTYGRRGLDFAPNNRFSKPVRRG